MRRVRNPDSYVPPKDAARFLRRAAADLEKREPDQWVALHLQSSFASKAEVEYSLTPRPARKGSKTND